MGKRLSTDFIHGPKKQHATVHHAARVGWCYAEEYERNGPKTMSKLPYARVDQVKVDTGLTAVKPKQDLVMTEERAVDVLFRA